MSKKAKKRSEKDDDGKKAKAGAQSVVPEALVPPSGIDEFDAASASRPKMKNKEYEAAMRILQGELVALQQWVVASGAKVMVVFEGRDTAGKGGTIRRITERTSPRVFRHVALPAPTDRERSQMYIQRYMKHFPAAGEVVIFDRSWYNRAGVEPVMGFCTPEQSARFLELVPATEKAIVDAGIILIKYWLEVSADEQTRRLRTASTTRARSGSCRTWT
jgi:polyphosphate kinase